MIESMPRRRTRQQHRSWLNRLLWWEPFWLLGLVPSRLFTEYFWAPTLRPLLIIVLFLFWPLRLKVTGTLLPHGVTGWFVGFLLLWLPVTIGRSPESARSWEVAGYLYFALATFVALIHWPPLHKQPGWLALLLLALGGGLAVVGPEFLSVNPDKLLDLYQAAEFGTTTGGETINPNILGSALALILPLGLALALHRQWSARRLFPLLLWAPILLIGNGLLLSQSRSSWLAVGVTGLLLGWLLLRPHPRIRLAVALLAAGLLLALLWFWANNGSRLVVDSAWLQSTQASLLRRLDIWRLSLQLIKDNWLTGVGLGSYEAAFTAVFPTLPLVGGRLAPPHAHNLFLQIALDVGLPGLVAFLGLLASLLRVLVNRLLQPQGQPVAVTAEPHAQPLAIGLYGALVAMLVIGCFDNALWGTKLTFIPWSLFALTFLVGEGDTLHDAAR